MGVAIMLVATPKYLYPIRVNIFCESVFARAEAGALLPPAHQFFLYNWAVPKKINGTAYYSLM
jgi:hypothetical protein